MKTLYLYYIENEELELICSTLTNHSMSIEDMLELNEIDMDEYAKSQGWDDWNYESLYLTTDEFHTYYDYVNYLEEEC